jgi:hypothetical protein
MADSKAGVVLGLYRYPVKSLQGQAERRLASIIRAAPG